MPPKTNYFKTFCTISKALGSTLNRAEVLTLIMDSAIETMDAKAACLFLAEKGADLFAPVAQKGLSADYLHADAMKAKDLIEELGREGHFAFRDATTDPRLENHDAKKKEGIASILTVPVRVRDRIIGVLSLYTATPRDFTRDEIDFLSALASQGGIAIETARLLERVGKNSRLFLDLAASINSSLDIKQVLNDLTARLGTALGMKGVVIRLLDKDSGTLQLVASYGLSDKFLNKGIVVATGCVETVMKGEVVAITDVAADDRIQYRQETLDEGIQSMLMVPIKAGDEIIGGMRLYSGVKRDFPEEMVTFVTALAHQGGLAIRNATLYLMTQEDKENLEKEIWSHRLWF